MNWAKTAKAAVLLAFVILTAVSQPQAADDHFPLPEVIAPNVAFWTKVYAQYTTGQGIVHDNADLERIYAVIDLIPYDVPNAGEINRKLIKQALEEYAAALNHLARDPNPADITARRVAALFKETRDAGQFTQAAARIRCQIGQKDRFQAGLIRSGAYIDEIRAIFRSYGLPEDLAYLPHVESSFNPNAYSKFGAAGMWQFIRSTGMRFMEVGYALDERRDPILSTHAAAQLLKENHAKLGDWPIAITAYNHGDAGMQRAKNLHGDFASIYQHYNSPSFKFASRNFYAEFLAARQVAVNYPAFFGNLELDRAVPTRTVVLEGYASFHDLTEHFKVDPQTLKQLNLALRQPVFSGQKYIPKGYALRLPVGPETGQSIETAAIPDALYRNMQKPSRFYTVQHGDTAGKIARRHAVKVDDLVAANNLDRRATVYPRQTLRIPRPGEEIPATLALSAEKGGSVTLAQAQPPQPVNAGVPVEPAPARASEPAEAEPFPQTLLASIIPLPAAQTEAETEAQQAAAQLHARNEQIVTADIGFERLVEDKGRTVGIIQVEPEETLGHYAEWSGVRTQHIRNLNGLRFDSLLRLHQKIKIPLHRVGAETFAQTRYEYHKRLQEDFFAVYRIGDLHPYQVRRGDNYWNLCLERFQIPLWLLMHSNPGVDLADLAIGRKLMIPIVEKASSANADPGTEEGFEEETIDALPESPAEADPQMDKAQTHQTESGV
ncbi:MAG: LysM peptidoglycan-binding domain-containing protein [Desulfobacteraceae bacterium]|nr:MAG: LysM peptidoglycan-binding domain-containing protein [Desulfobacteraceae bacterium]